MCLQTASKLVFRKKSDQPALAYLTLCHILVQFQLKYVIHRGHVPGSVILPFYYYLYYVIVIHQIYNSGPKPKIQDALGRKTKNYLFFYHYYY